jgi:RNA polymerase sigma-70 factor (ECF subfamily)
MQKRTPEERGQTLERLMEDYGDRAMRTCLLFLQDRPLAEDASQETFIRAWQGLRSFRQMSGFETWLLRIAYNAFLDDERKEKSRPRGEESVSLSDGNSILNHNRTAFIESQSLTSDFSMRHDLDLALSTLSEAERTCVVLQCMEGQSIHEIAKITGMLENSVKSHLLRGKKNLAVYLRKNGYS